MREKIVDFLWGTQQRKIWTSVIVGLFAASILIRFIAPVPPPHVALSGEPIFSTGPKWFTNSVLTTIIVDIVLILLALAVRFNLKEIPGAFQNFMEAIIEALYGLAESVAGKNASKFFPWVATIFLFVIISNWSGMLPGVGSIGFYHPTDKDKHGEHAAASESSCRPASSTGNWRWREAASCWRRRSACRRRQPPLKASTASLSRSSARPAPT
ncbi:F0F1 ATP synthase subunit A [Caldilinea sp.]|uniref:F0F1 ATP synthase subunit A n=1 Tax=Caldilinea sp. TaxID=2293560 RepID=UPI0035B563A9